MDTSEAAELTHPPAAPFGAAGMADGSGQQRETRRRKPKREEAEDAFALWLHRGLHQLYDQVAQEPLPPELLKLIEEDKGRS